MLLVVIALQLLHGGNGTLGWLNVAAGIGSIAGAFFVAALATRRRLAGGFALGLLLSSIPLALTAAVSISRPGARPPRRPRGRLGLLPGQQRDAAAALCRERGDGPRLRSPRELILTGARGRIARRPRSGELARHARSADCVGSVRARPGRSAVAEPAADRRRGRDRGGAARAAAEDRDLRAAAGAGARAPRGRSYCDLGRCRRRRRLARRGRQPLLCHRGGQGRSGARRRNDPGARAPATSSARSPSCATCRGRRRCERSSRSSSSRSRGRSSSQL